MRSLTTSRITLPSLLLLLSSSFLVQLPTFAFAQSCSETLQNPTCVGDKRFTSSSSGVCCQYPSVCYFKDRSGTPGCCPYGEECLTSGGDGESTIAEESVTVTTTAAAEETKTETPVVVGVTTTSTTLVVITSTAYEQEESTTQVVVAQTSTAVATETYQQTQTENGCAVVTEYSTTVVYVGQQATTTTSEVEPYTTEETTTATTQATSTLSAGQTEGGLIVENQAVRGSSNGLVAYGIPLGLVLWDFV